MIPPFRWQRIVWAIPATTEVYLRWPDGQHERVHAWAAIADDIYDDESSDDPTRSEAQDDRLVPLVIREGDELRMAEVDGGQLVEGKPG